MAQAKTPVPREIRLAVIGVLIAFAWEIWQMPLYAMAGTGFAEAIRGCSLAAFGDAGIMVAGYWLAARLTGRRDWPENAGLAGLSTYLAAGLAIAVAVEIWALRAPGGWRYGAAMPVDPWLGIGLAPLAMWIVVPLVSLGLVRWLERG